MNSEDIGLIMLITIISFAGYGVLRLFMDVVKYLKKRKRQNERIIGRYDE
jgi:hypothetical protein